MSLVGNFFFRYVSGRCFVSEAGNSTALCYVERIKIKLINTKLRRIRRCLRVCLRQTRLLIDFHHLIPSFSLLRHHSADRSFRRDARIDTTTNTLISGPQINAI